jgi:hypothetical protein
MTWYTTEDARRDAAKHAQLKETDVVVHITPKIDEECDHDWEDGADGNPERCSKCGLSFMRFVHSCCQ